MKDASQYPITQGYGYDPNYPLNNGQHLGIDYGCPVGTPIVVNGVTIGLSGATGYVTGAHLHLGRWVNGQATDPKKSGFTFKSAKVTEINQDSVNGKYVRVQGDGASYVYLHMSNNAKVKVGQVLKGAPVNNTKPVSYYRANQISHAVLCRGMTEAEFNKYHKGKTEYRLFEAFRKSAEHKRAEALVQKG